MTNLQSATPNDSFKLNYVTGDLATSAPDNAVLIHSCNCVGKWGTGVATALAHKFPTLVKTCQEYCKDHSIEELLGTCVMAWAEDEDVSRTQWVACLFTSKGYGKKTPSHPGESSPSAITAHTRTALQDLRQQLEYYKNSTPALARSIQTSASCGLANSIADSLAWSGLSLSRCFRRSSLAGMVK